MKIRRRTRRREPAWTWRGCIAGVLVVGSALLSAEAAAEAPARAPAITRFAIVIGNNRPEAPSTPTLRYADDDAVATHALLVEAGVRSVLLARLDEDTERFLPGVAPNGPPRGADFDAAVRQLFTEMRDATARGLAPELLFFYSGHGDVAAGEGYVMLEDRRLTRGDLHALLVASPAVRNHVFIDACKSYFLAFERGPGGQRVPYAEALAPAAEPGSLDRVGFVLSTSSDRESHEWERFQGGILSHELRSALRGGADVNGDGRVTYAELGAFVTTANRAIDNPRFRPDVLVRPPGHDLGQDVLRWTMPPPPVRVQGGALGHLYVESARGERILDAHPPAGLALSLHVPHERPLFVRKSDGTAEYIVPADQAPSRSPLGDEPPLPRRGGDIRSKGALNLAFESFFALPFQPGDIETFAKDQARLAGEEAAAAAAAREERFHANLRTGFLLAGAGGLVAGLTLSGIALERSLTNGGSQVEIADRNHTIRRANLASIVGYAVAATGGAVWAWSRWRHPPTLEVATGGEAGPGWSVSLASTY